MVALSDEVGDILKLNDRLAALEMRLHGRESQPTANWAALDELEYFDDYHLTDAVSSADEDRALDRDLLEAKIEASEARTDAKFADVRSDLAGMRGEFAALRGDIAGIAASLREEIVNGRAQATTDNANLRTEVGALLGENARTVGEIRGELQGVRAVVESKPGRIDIWGAALAGFALLIGVLAYAGDRESVGLSLADRRQEQLQIDSAQNNTAASIDAKLDRLLAAEERTAPARP